MLHYV